MTKQPVTRGLPPRPRRHDNVRADRGSLAPDDERAEPKGQPTADRYHAETVHHHPSQIRPDKPPHTE
jgi:hypothetical protein